jgi:hypothetical protein
LTPLEHSNIRSIEGTFSGCANLKSIDFTPLRYSPITNISGCASKSGITSLDLTPFSGKAITDIGNLFSGLNVEYVDLEPLAGAPITDASYLFLGNSKLTSVDLSPLSDAPLTDIEGMFKDCSGLTSVDLSPLDLSGIKSLGYVFSGCTLLKSIDLSPFNSSIISTMTEAFKGCRSLMSIDLGPLKNAVPTSWRKTFDGCIKMSEIICPWMNAPKVSDDTFGYYQDDAVGKSSGVQNYLYIPVNATGYDGALWLGNMGTGRGNFQIKNAYEATECVSLTITADNVSGKKTNTTIHWTAVTNGVDPFSGTVVNGIEMTGTATSEEFPQNTSETDVAERVISFTYMGVTATTTIVQGVWVNTNYSVNLNGQWELSTAVANPDSALYDGVYQSFSNKGVNDTEARCYIDFSGYETFKVYIRSYAETKYDYVVISNLDAELSNNPTSTSTGVKSHTSNNQKGGTSISDYTLVEYTGLDGGEHRITVVYRKDSSGDNNDDRGYLLIPKNQ